MIKCLNVTSEMLKLLEEKKTNKFFNKYFDTEFLDMTQKAPKSRSQR